MIYLLFFIGIILITVALKRFKGKMGPAFESVVTEIEKDHGEYIKIMANNQEILDKLTELDDKVNKVMILLNKNNETNSKNTFNIEEKQNASRINETETPKIYFEMAQKIREMENQNKSIEEITSTLQIGKGEALFLKNLFKK